MDMSLQQALNKGEEAVRSGQFREAYRCFKSVLKADPNHSDTHFRLGRLAVELGAIPEALYFFQSAVTGNKESPELWLGLIETLVQLGRIDGARTKIALAIENGVSAAAFAEISTRMDALDRSRISGVGVKKKTNILDTMSLDQAIRSVQKLTKQGAIADARQTLADILERFPKNKRALELRKTLLDKGSNAANRSVDPPQPLLDPLINTFRMGQLKSVIAQAASLAKTFPNSAVLENVLGVAYAGLGQFDDALQHYGKALALFPDFAEAHNNMGICHHERHEALAAIDCFQRAVALKPDYAEAYFNMGNTLRKIDDNASAISNFQNAIDIKPNYAEALNNLGNALADAGDIQNAVQCFEAAIKVRPDYAEAFFNMANAYKLNGDNDAAIRCYDRAIVIRLDYIEAYQNLAMITALAATDPRYLKMVDLHENTGMSPDLRSRLCFALAMSAEKQGETEGSFRYLQEGNSLRKESLCYDITRDLISFDVIKEVGRALKTCGPVGETPPYPAPIFVLGMPRSGTTIVEQIISSHSRVLGAGELKYVPEYGAAIAQGGADLTPETIGAFRDRYLEKITEVSDGHPFVTDKLPENFKYIGLIFAAFPDARIVRVRRNPAATCWSIYKQYFTTGGLGFAYAIQDIVEYYKSYTDMMAFWHDQFPGRIYDLTYEDLTLDQELQTRNLLRYLGLPWEQACLSPENNTRNVLTASQQQVRKKLYQGSSQDWLKFKPYLGDAFAALG